MDKNLQITNRFFIKQPISDQLKENIRLLLALNFGITKLDSKDCTFEITIPKNWNFEMKNNLLIFIDEQNRDRINCFYTKKDGHLFFIEYIKFLNFLKLDFFENPKTIRVSISDSNSNVWFSAEEPNDKSKCPFNHLLKAASSFLLKNFPDWENPISYWDEP